MIENIFGLILMNLINFNSYLHFSEKISDQSNILRVISVFPKKVPKINRFLSS